jgi:putative flippase GtrA
MKPLLSSKPETAYETQRVERTEISLAEAPRTPAPPAAPGPLASFARFVLFGGGVGVLSSGAVAGLAGLMPWAVANALITVASTILCTELHARFTFGTGGRADLRQHWQSAGSATAAYAVTSVAILVLHVMQPSPGMLTEQVVYLSASGLAGLGRFLLLRLFVFATGRGRTTTNPKNPAPVQEARRTISSPVSIPAPKRSRNAVPTSRPAGHTPSGHTSAAGPCASPGALTRTAEATTEPTPRRNVRSSSRCGTEKHSPASRQRYQDAKRPVTREGRYGWRRCRIGGGPSHSPWHRPRPAWRCTSGPIRNG